MQDKPYWVWLINIVCFCVGLFMAYGVIYLVEGDGMFRYYWRHPGQFLFWLAPAVILLVILHRRKK